MDFFTSHVLPSFAMILFWIYYQATPGKMCIRGKIVDAQTGNKPSTAQFIGRYLVLYLSLIVWLNEDSSFLLTSIFVVGILWIAFDKKNKDGMINLLEQL